MKLTKLAFAVIVLGSASIAATDSQAVGVSFCKKGNIATLDFSIRSGKGKVCDVSKKVARYILSKCTGVDDFDDSHCAEKARKKLKIDKDYFDAKPSEQEETLEDTGVELIPDDKFVQEVAKD